MYIFALGLVNIIILIIENRGIISLEKQLFMSKAILVSIIIPKTWADVCTAGFFSPHVLFTLVSGVVLYAFIIKML